MLWTHRMFQTVNNDAMGLGKGCGHAVIKAQALDHVQKPVQVCKSPSEAKIKIRGGHPASPEAVRDFNRCRRRCYQQLGRIGRSQGPWRNYFAKKQIGQKAKI